MRPVLRYALLTLVGTLLAQAAWILAVPPFRGSDEFDHAFRAAGVASGQWRLTEAAAAGRGLVVEVPADLVRAAEAQCEALEYTGQDNCEAIDDVGGGRVAIATAAGNYNPLFYWVVGTAAEPFDGAAALYAMRVANAFLCALGISLAALLLGGITRGWGRIAFLAALTPVLVYSTVVPGPNGLEMIAGLCLWASLLRLTEAPGRHGAALFALAGGAAAALGVLRLLGPAWMAAIVVTVMVFAGPATIRRRLAEHPRPAALATLLAAAGTVAGGVWTLTAGLGIGTAQQLASTAPTDPTLEAVAELGFWDAFQLPIWLLQVVAAFPLRDEPAPIVVYPLVLCVVVALVVAALRRAHGWSRAGLVLCALLALFMPVAPTLATMHSEGLVWQGRYVLPYGVGLLLLAGVVLARGRARSAPGPTLVATAMLAAAHVVSVVGVVRGELANPVSTGDGDWLQPPTVVIGGLMAAAWIVQALATRADQDQDQELDRGRGRGQPVAAP